MSAKIAALDQASPELIRKVARGIQVSLDAAMLLTPEIADPFLKVAFNPEVRLDADILESPGIKSRLKKMATRLKDEGRTITAHGPYSNLCPGALDPMILKVTRRRVRQALTVAAQIKPKYVVFHADFFEPEYGRHRQRWLDNSLGTWREAAQIAGDLGLIIVLENTYEASPEDLKPLLDEVASRGVGFLLDVGHIHALGGGSARDWLTAFGPQLKAVHLHDNHGHYRDEHLALGQGTVPLALAKKALKEAGLNPIMVLENRGLDRIKLSLEYLAAHWADWGLAPDPIAE